MFVVTVVFEIFPESVDAFIAKVRGNAAQSLSQEPDCHVFDVCIGHKMRTNIFLYEVYESEAAFHFHLKTDHFISFDEQVREMVSSKTITFYCK
jgi:autoinducer 2-degrading protein